MFTTRNVFIANMAVSDILLCSFTIPFTLLDILTKHWTLGQNMVRIEPAFNINIYQTRCRVRGCYTNSVVIN